ncbi:MAG TPA: flavoprotein [Gemmataceae bacterium]|jgi:phosphopantothenoylcysteine decarboxylase
MANVLLGVTGSVAAVRTPPLHAALRGQGHSVRIVATDAALYFFDPAELDPAHVGRNPEVVTIDADEWPGRDGGRRYGRDDTVLHIELRRWADLFVVAPLDANTLAKLATGLADNCLTCVWRAWDVARPVVLAPAMNTLMWDHPLTMRNLRQLAADTTGRSPPDKASDEALIDWINANAATLRIVGPITKRLACGDVGVGAMAEVDAIVAAVSAAIGPR